MTTTVSPAMQRKAEALAALVPTFSRGRDKRTGIDFVTVPSSDDPEHTGHNTNGLGCTCDGYRHRGVCTHQLAVAIWHQRAEAPVIAAAQAQKRTYRDIFPVCSQDGCDEDVVGKSGRCSEHLRQQRIAA